MTTPNDDISDGIGTYPVVLLVEKALTSIDAAQVRALHDQIADRVEYHVLLPVDDAAARIEASLGTMGAGDLMSTPAIAISETDIDAVRRECEEQANEGLAASIAALQAAGGTATGEVITLAPIDALSAAVASTNAREAIIFTRSHLVAEFFHVDWTSRARRKLGVPVLHLIEAETFDGQAGGGEGVTGL